MQRYSAPAITDPIDGEFYWLRVTSYTAGATYKLDGQVCVADCLAAYHFDPNKPIHRLILTGTITIEVSDSRDEPYPGPVSKG